MGMKEWREIDGFPNYERINKGVSQFVRSSKTSIKNILRSCKNNNATAYSYKWKLKTL